VQVCQHCPDILLQELQYLIAVLTPGVLDTYLWFSNIHHCNIHINIQHQHHRLVDATDASASTGSSRVIVLSLLV
jgi:hypothetical protein